MDNLQRSYLMGYDAGLWGHDSHNHKEIMLPEATQEEIDWWMAGFDKGQLARYHDRESRKDEQSERQRE